MDQHRLARLAARAGLRADAIGRCQRQPRTVPERRVIARMVVGVAAQDVEDQPAEQLPQRLARRSGGG